MKALIAAAAVEAFLRPPLCLPSHKVITDSLEAHGEHVVGHGVTGLGMLMQVWASESGTWSIVLILPSGAGCMIEAGEDWERILGKSL